jgi:hypothetical protein
MHLIITSVAKSLDSVAALRGLMIVSILLLFHTTDVRAREVTLAWNANPEPALGGYRLYYGPTSRNYTSVVDVGNQTTYTVFGLADNSPYYFAVTAYDSSKTIESGFSNELFLASATLLANQESPSKGSYESGIGLIRGWVCDASTVEVEINGGERLSTGHGTQRGDTVGVCGDANNGFGYLVNWNNLGDGTHTLRAFADGLEFARAQFTVTTLGVDYLRGASGAFSLPNFPRPGESVTVRWSEVHQNFVIVDTSANRTRVNQRNTANKYPFKWPSATQESPSEGSHESGIGLIRGWACDAQSVEIQINDGARQPVAYGFHRPDTIEVCGDTNNGFGFVFNWNSLGDGTHTLRALADGVEFANVSFQVTTLGTDFLRGAPEHEYVLPNFPRPGASVIIRWSEAHQNFVIVRFENQ